MNSDMLKGKIRGMGMTQEAVAVKIGVSLSRFNAKINGTNGAEFSLREVQILKKILSLDMEEVDSIFFVA